MIETIIATAIQEALFQLPPLALGLRSHAIPTEEYLDECVKAAQRILKEPRFFGCRFVIGSSRANGQTLDGIAILPPDAAAAEATRLRNDKAAVGSPGFLLIYLNGDSTPGEAGLDVLCELRAQAVAQHFAQRSDLPLLAEVAKSKVRRIVHRLEDSSIDLLSRYATTAAKNGSESYALPLLGLLPRDHAAPQPSVTWAADFDSLTGEKLVARLREALRVLEGVSPSDRKALTAQFTDRLVPNVRAFRDDRIAFALRVCQATLRFASGHVDEVPEICGLTSSLLRLFRKGISITEIESSAQGMGEGATADPAVESTRRPPLEEDVLHERGAEALISSVSRLDEDGRVLTLTAADGGEWYLRSREGATLVDRMIRKLSPNFWLEGAGVHISSVEPLLTPLTPNDTAFSVVSKLGDWQRDCSVALRPRIAEFLKRRVALIRKLSEPALIGMDASFDEDDPEESVASGGDRRAEIQGVLVLEAFPLAAISIARAEAEAYVGAYEALLLAVSADNTAALDGEWLTNLDVAFHADKGLVVAARLLPTHPLRLTHAMLWLDHGRRPPNLPASLAVHHRRRDSLTPHGREYSFHNTQTVGPGTDGLATAAKEGIRSLWTLVAARGLARAMEVELVDISNPVEVIEALCAEVLDCFEEDTSVGNGVHLRIACAFSEQSRETEVVVPAPEDLLSLASELLGARPGGGVTLELQANARKAGTSQTHLVIQAIDTPYVRLPIDHNLANLPGTEVAYVPGPSGNISLVKVTGNAALDAYQRFLEQSHLPTWLGYGPVDRSQVIGPTLVRTLVCRQGWPLKLPFDDSFLSYSEDGQHIVVSLCDPEVLRTLTREKLSALSERIEGDAIIDPHRLREGIRAMYSCRSFIPKLLADADPRHLLGDLGLLRAFSAARIPHDGRELLLISLDGPDGRSWARTAAGLVEGQETRADLLILEADEAMERIVGIRVAELKARTSAAELGAASALKGLARQAQITAARVRSCFSDPDESRRQVRVDALRRLVWMGAGHQLLAFRWKQALNFIDRALADHLQIDVGAECWIVPEDEWTGEHAFSRSLPLLSEVGEGLPGDESVRFRVLSRQAIKAPPPTTNGNPAPKKPAKQGVRVVLPGGAEGPGRELPEPISRGDVVPSKASPGEQRLEAPPPEIPIASAPRVGGTATKDLLEIPLGKNATTGKIEAWSPYATTPRLSNQHILVVGKSGSGKSETTKALIWELEKRGVPSIIFDYQGEYGDKSKDFFKVVRPQVFDVMQGLPINPFQVPIDPRTGERRPFIESVFRLADTLSRVFKGSGDIQLGVLREAIRLCYLRQGFVQDRPETWANEPPTVEMLQSALDEMSEERGAQVRNLQVRLQPLFESGIFRPGHAGFRFEELFKRTTVILMTSGISDLMLAASRLMLEGIYSSMLTLGESATIRVMACVDEAHKLCGDETITTLIKEARKYGLGLILSSQETRDFHPSVFANVGTIVCLQLEEADAAVMAKQIAGQDPPRQKQLRQVIMNQAFPDGIVRSNHFQPYVALRLTPFHERVTPEVPPPARGEQFLNYELIKPLKGGGMAEVYQARDRLTGELVCVKRVRTSSVDADALQREAQIYQKLLNIECPNLLKVHGFEREGDYIALVTDFAEGGDLGAYVRGEQGSRLRPAKVKQIGQQIASALRVLHRADIVHRDLKPENILLKGDRWQIADFGIAKNLTRLVTMRTFQHAGTLGYMAPEQMDGSEAHPAADIYSFAKILVFLLTGATDKDYVTQTGWRLLLTECLHPEPDKRPTIEHLIAALERIAT